jgi:hypothetical protein
MDVAERHENDGKNLDQRQLTAAKKASREITKNKEGSNNQLEVIYKDNDTIAE